MRTYALLPLIVLLIFAATPAYAAPFGEGAFEFENCGVDCALVGSWGTVTSVAQTTLNTSTVSGYIEFQVTGRYLLVYRGVASLFGTMTVSVNGGSAVIVSNDNGGSSTYLPYIRALPAGTNTIRITANSIYLYLDYFVVLNDPSGSFPTAVPTATILPSSTPASTTTPQPTPTPQPTATPLSLVWAISPGTKYDAAGGQIVGFDYTVSVGDVVIGFLLFGLFGAFIFKMFLDEMGKRK